MMYARFLGFTLIGTILLIGLFACSSPDNNVTEESVTQLPPNLDGPVDAPIKIVEYGDFGCTTCRAWHNSGTKQVLQDQYGEQISFEFRHFPIITAQSPKAAEAGQCAAEQNKFWEFHNFVYEETAQGALSDSDLKDYASAIGLNRDSFDECLDSGKYEATIQASSDAAREAGASRTPAFFINGIQTAPRLDDLSAQIDAELSN